ncbi:MAG TPA: DEAD/DEAH box helicase [Methylomirabilota bacterium]|jgi:non-specific serine/threonine protein kinase|nr:DEAD/DEAH box helicase [Methylomirabilota bacterium]
MRVAILPSGALLGDTAPDDEGAGDGLSVAARARVLRAFGRGSGHALLDLGATELDAPLAPPLAFLRDIGRAFVTRLCALPDLEERRERVEVDCPPDESARLAGAVPPMDGAEYVDADWVAARWSDLDRAFADEIRAHRGSVADWLRARHPSWHAVGKVCLHLAENRGDEEHPFAFLATYAARAGAGGKVQHRALARALEESSARGDRQALLHLLVPLQRAAQQTPWLAELIDSGAIYEAMAWTPSDAHRFLRAIPALESAGLVVRVPDWWRARRPPRPEVTVRVGEKKPSEVGMDALLDFSVAVALGDDKLTAAEVRQLLASSGGLVRLRGQWVELDRERLREVLAHWERVRREAQDNGLSFLDGMRLLAGAGRTQDDAAALTASEGWSRVEAGAWLARTLEGLRGPSAIAATDPGADLRGTLRPYQKVGVSWLAFASSLRLGVCLADDMGLGKTIQVLALLLLHKRRARPGGPPHLLVAPASLLANWQAEIERFAPSLAALVAHPSAMPTRELAELAGADLDTIDLVITTYGTLARVEALRARAWSLAILDEAQAIKNPGARQTQAVKTLKAHARIALTGTPVENRLGDLWSIYDFLDPGLLGSAREFSAFAKRLAERPDESYAPLRRLIQPYLLRRLKTDRSVVADLPDKTEVKAFCLLSGPQAALYQQTVDELERTLASVTQGIERRGLVLAYLMRFKQICNHPAHWLGQGAWDEAGSGKLARLREIVEAVAAKQEKALVFTQFREATEPLVTFLTSVFGRAGLVLHGSTPVKDRGGLVRRFQEDATVPFFVLSLKAGGSGLNLTAASHVVHFDRWWNPAVEDQATDRAYRIGQHRNVLVHKLVCRGTVEERIDRLIEGKQTMARGILQGGAETLLTEMSDEQLMAMVALDLNRATAEA